MKQGFFVFCLSCFILATAHLAAEELKSFKDVAFGSPREKLGEYCYGQRDRACRKNENLFYLDEKEKFFAVRIYFNYSKEGANILDMLSPISDHALQIDKLIQKYGKPSQSNEDGGIGQIIKDAAKEPVLYSTWEMDNDSGIISVYTKDSFRTTPHWFPLSDRSRSEYIKLMDSVFYIGAGHFQEVRAFLFRYTLPEVLARE